MALALRETFMKKELKPSFLVEDHVQLGQGSAGRPLQGVPLSLVFSLLRENSGNEWNIENWSSHWHH